MFCGPEFLAIDYLLQLSVSNCPAVERSFIEQVSPIRSLSQLPNKMQSRPDSDPCFVGHNLTHAVSLGEKDQNGTLLEMGMFKRGLIERVVPFHICPTCWPRSGPARIYYHFAIEAQSCSFIDGFMHVYSCRT
jgi:hypothetical protein